MIKPKANPDTWDDDPIPAPPPEAPAFIVSYLTFPDPQIMNRKIEPREQLVIDRLLDAIPSVSGSLREQLASAKIEDDGDFSMIKFAEVLGPRVNVPRVPVEAVTRPLDDPSAINVLLHVKNGMLFILECYRNDGGSVEVRDIDVDKLDVFSRVV